MRTELFILLLSVGLGFLQLVMATAAMTRVRGRDYNFSSRDAVLPPLTGKPARLDRAFQNFKETFPFFLAAILIVISQDKTGMISALSAITYLVARIVYVFLYVYDVIYIRSMVWVISVLGIFGVLLQTLL